MTRPFDMVLTALAPIIWGTTYYVTTEMMPPGYPLTLAVLRALPAGLILLLVVRRLPQGAGQWGEAFILGGLNFTIFWACLFVAAYRLPGGVAATVGAIQPLLVIGLSRLALNSPIRPLAVYAGLAGLVGVALLVLGPSAALDPIGVMAGLLGAFAMAGGTVFSRKWRRDTPLLTFTAWQLAAGGIMLLPLALVFEPELPRFDAAGLAGLVWLGLIGAALTYALWFRGVQRIEPAIVSTLGFLSPLTAVLVGWLALGEVLSLAQAAGAILVLGGVWLSGRPPKPKPVMAE